MPAFMTHTILGDEVFSSLPDDVKAMLFPKYAAYSWGLIGPDLLFFRNVMTGRSPLPLYGSTMHRSRVQELFRAMFDFLSSRRGYPEYPALLAYCCGFVCHYRLDSIAHPFVYSLQRRQDGMTLDRRRGGAHHRIEADLDTAVFRYLTGLSPAAVKLRGRLSLDSGAALGVGRLYEAVLAGVYGISVPPEEIAKCFSDALRIECLLLDPTGWVMETLTGAVDRFSNKSPLSAHVVKKQVGYDVLNLRHEPWRRGAVNGETLNDSFMDLYRRAAEQSAGDVTALCRSQRDGGEFRLLCREPFDHDGDAGVYRKEERQ